VATPGMPRGAAGVGRGEGPEPVQLAHEIARKNRGAPGSPRGVWTIVGLLPAVVMAAVDARRRSVAASLAWAVALFAFSAAGLARSPAFRVMVPGPVETETMQSPSVSTARPQVASQNGQTR